MLRHYRRQLSDAGINLDAIEPPGQVASTYYGRERMQATGRKVLREKALQSSKLIDVEGDEFVIAFRYDADLVTDVRTLPGRHWDGRFNRVPLSSASAVAEFAKKHSFKLTDKADEYIASAPPPHEIVPAAVDLDSDGKTFAVYLTPGHPDFEVNLTFLRNLQGRRWNKVNRIWEVSTLNGPELVAYALRHGWDVSNEAISFVDQQADRETSIEESMATDAVVDLDGFGPEGESLFGFQRAGVAYAIKRLASGGVLIADEMGLGKTLQALGVAWYLDAAPLVIVCPAALKRNWEREINKWMPGLNIAVLAGKKPDYGLVADADVVIVNYDILGDLHAVPGSRTREPAGWIEALAKIQPKMLVVDEAHYAKNENAKRTRALLWLSKQVENVLLLTGTPVVNRPVELVPLLKMMGRIAEFGGPRQFKNRYCEPIYSKWGTTYGGAANLEELNQRLRSSCYVRRTKAQVMPDLPPKLRSVIDVDLTNRAEYELAERDFVAWLLANGYDPGRVLQAEALARLTALRRLAAKGKVRDAIEWTKEFLESSDEKLVLFAHHREAQEALYKAFPGAVRVIGGANDANDASVQRFQNDPDTRLIVVSLMAGQAGFTLHAASHVAFLELGWTPKDMRQAEDRVHRIGQTAEMVNVYWLLCQDSIDTDMEAVLSGKAAVVDAATDGEVSNAEDGMRATVAHLVSRHQR
jgi:SWI/SNF-related matrix-associated actin-dependent regulator 1 of chromatin subfamily A